MFVYEEDNIIVGFSVSLECSLKLIYILGSDTLMLCFPIFLIEVIESHNKCLLSIYYVSDTMLSAGNTMVNKHTWSLCLWGTQTSGGKLTAFIEFQSQNDLLRSYRAVSLTSFYRKGY